MSEWKSNRVSQMWRYTRFEFNIDIIARGTTHVAVHLQTNQITINVLSMQQTIMSNNLLLIVFDKTSLIGQRHRDIRYHLLKITDLQVIPKIRTYLY